MSSWGKYPNYLTNREPGKTSVECKEYIAECDIEATMFVIKLLLYLRLLQLVLQGTIVRILLSLG